ncbi:MAG: sugar phosphate isomerase/epimerase [Clostridiales bacterium]|nr:sugar phosphate isomerase/epimerase [Clostridiales bacterium]
MKITFTTFQIGSEMTLDELIDLAHATGCAGIELRVSDNYKRGAEHVNKGEKPDAYQHAYKHGVEITCTDEERRLIRRKIEDNYLEIVSITTGFMFHYTNQEDRIKNIAGAKEACKLAYDLGCKRIRVFGNIIPDGVNAQDCVDYVTAAVTEVADFALPLGVDVMLEMHGQYNYWGYSLAVMEQANRTNMGLLYNCDKRDLVGGSMRETFGRVKKYVRHVHMHEICDSYPYQQLFEELVNMDYQGYVSAEIKPSSDPVRVLSLYNKAVNLYIELAKYTMGKKN